MTGGGPALDATGVREQVDDIVERHEAWRGCCLNLIASENALSPAVRAALGSDLVQRYADYTGRDLRARRYRGTRHVVELEELTTTLACEVFHARHVELRPIAGHVAGAAIVMGLCAPGDTLLEPGRDAGGHREASKLASPSLMPLDVRFLPFDAERYTVDAAAAAALIETVRPRVVILGSSNFLFPHPVRELADALHRARPDGVLVYDASHVLGLIAGGRFQDPLREGADIVFGSTHKTFPGPQGGIVFSDRDDLMNAVSEAVYPALVTNHHAFRMPALALALAEMREWGAGYADQVIANSRRLGDELDAVGIPVVRSQGRASDSHTLLVRVGAFGTGEEAATRLEAANIITTSAFLPPALGGEGIRVGTQEITRLGATEDLMPSVATVIADAAAGRRPAESIAADVAAIAAALGPVRFTWRPRESPSR